MNFARLFYIAHTLLGFTAAECRVLRTAEVIGQFGIYCEMNDIDTEPNNDNEGVSF